MSRRSRGQREADLRVERGARWAETIASVLKTAIAWGGAVWITYWMFRTVATLAGRQTGADIDVGFLADVKVSTALAWALTSMAGGVAVRERRLRKSTIERLSRRTEELEQRLDPKRSSSALTRRGETNPIDRI